MKPWGILANVEYEDRNPSDEGLAKCLCDANDDRTFFSIIVTEFIGPCLFQQSVLQPMCLTEIRP